PDSGAAPGGTTGAGAPLRLSLLLQQDDSAAIYRTEGRLSHLRPQAGSPAAAAARGIARTRHHLRRHPVESSVCAARPAGAAQAGRVRRTAYRGSSGRHSSAGILGVIVILLPLALLFSLLCLGALCGLGARVATAIGAVVPPRPDRWHSAPTPTMGGVAIAPAAVVAFAVIAPHVNAGATPSTWLAIPLAGLAMFVVGVLDDRLQLTPLAKLVSSLIIG